MTPNATDAERTAWLERLQFQADPLADATIERILGPWPAPDAVAERTAIEAQCATQWQRLAQVTRLIGQWQRNAELVDWRCTDPAVPREVAAALEDYVRAAQRLPDWADAALIARAEALFFDIGVLSCTLLFCASLPECYVVPDLAEVLHVSGQLERHTEYRIRATAAMVFPVMMRGGLTSGEGGGIVQTLKVRLIHATIRNLVLRGSPERAVAALAHSLGLPETGASGAAGAALRQPGRGVVAPLAALRGTPQMHQAMFGHGWRLGDDGLPCNQEEMGYTLLTFSYVYLRGLRTLGLGLSPEDERATLHAWNVMGHLVGIDRALMVERMDEAAALFATMQARGRAEPVTPDPRPSLGNTLMDQMASLIPLAIAKPVPRLLTRHLCGDATARDIGLDTPVPLAARLFFMLGLGLVRLIDSVVRLVWRDFSIARLITRVLGYHLITKLLMDQTRPLKLPEHLIGRVNDLLGQWSEDARAPRWMNSLEDRFTTRGRWMS